MQQYEQGKLDLDRDVNEYLDFKIPDAFGKPITLKNILTHTPGFEEQIKDLFTDDTSSPDLGNYCKTHIPRRIFPPGEVPAYSNYATALAGYIVERVSGQPFSQYVDANIFKPLKMTRSTFEQPLPAELAPLMSSGYRLGSDEAKPFEMVTAFPAGSLSSPAEDMSRFMLAHLNGGELDGARILKPETAKLMHSRLFALDDKALGMAHGFYEESANGLRIIGHGGDTTLFHSDLHLIPDEGVGFYVSHNSGGKGEISPRSIIWEAFLDRYFPDTRPEVPTLETAKQDAAAVAGNYIGSRRPEGSFLRALAILGEVNVAPNEDGTISIALLTDPNDLPRCEWPAFIDL
jgi:CubicO group peptidase (beta-lactamase class C family)